MPLWGQKVLKLSGTHAALRRAPLMRCGVPLMWSAAHVERRSAQPRVHRVAGRSLQPVPNRQPAGASLLQVFASTHTHVPGHVQQNGLHRHHDRRPVLPPRNLQVSRRHATLAFRGNGTCWISDVGSSNGCAPKLHSDRSFATLHHALHRLCLCCYTQRICNFNRQTAPTSS